MEPLAWADAHWKDPDGGAIHLHGVLPCVVFPGELRPHTSWDGLAILANDEEPETWEFEEESERESPGINMADAMISGGLNARYLEALEFLEEVKGPRFPDPEPRRLHRIAEKNDRPVTWIEPLPADKRWLTWLENQADRLTSPLRLLKIFFQRGRYHRIHIQLSKCSKPIPGMEPELFIAGCLAGAWWYEQEFRLGAELASSRDKRFAARLRGALAELRESCGRDDVTLLLPHHLPRRHDLLRALDDCPTPEHPSKPDDSSKEEEA